MKILIQAMFAITLSAGAAAAQLTPALTPRSLEAALAANPQGPAAELLAEEIRQAFGGVEELTHKHRMLTEGTTVAWASEWPNSSDACVTPSIYLDGTTTRFPMRRVGSTPVFVVVRNFENAEAVQSLKPILAVPARSCPPSAPR